jgi:YD repeat-containing protein
MRFGMTSQVQKWVNRTVANNGFVARLSSELYNIGGPYWSYLGDRGTAVGNLPYLQVTYTPNAPTTTETLGGSNPAENVKQCHRTAYPVNCATGNFWHTFSDLAIPGRGPALDLNRTYNSLAAGNDGPFGFGWASSYTMSLLNPTSSTVTVRQENGSEVSFSNLYGSYYAPPRVLASLVKNADATFTYTRRQRERFVFSSSGKLVKVLDLNGYATTLAYNGSGQLSSVTDPAGRTFSWAYGANAKVASVTDPAGRKVAYGYDGAGNLTSVTDVAGGVTRFGYDAAHRMLTMTDPRGGKVTNTYDSSSGATTQTDALGRPPPTPTTPWAASPRPATGQARPWATATTSRAS